MESEDQLVRFREESAERLARLRPSDTLKGLFVRRYLALSGELGSADLAARARKAFDEPKIHDFLSYPYANLVRMGLVVVDALVERYGTVDACLELFGHQATASYLGSALGRAFLDRIKPAPSTVLAGMPWAIRTAFSFGQRSVTFPEEGQCVFACRRDFSPAASNAGAVRAAIEAVGAKDVAISVSAQDLFNYDLLVTWR